jgi:hypothetical protein
MGNETITKHINENQDSVEIGTPAKGGAVKIYGNFNDLEGFKAKIEVAVLVKKHAQLVLMGEKYE